jgi:hypothetical protein
MMSFASKLLKTAQLTSQTGICITMGGLFFLKNNEEAIDSGRDLAENGLYCIDFESRFSAVRSKAAEVAYCQIDFDRCPGNRSDQKVAEVSEKAEGTKMAFLRKRVSLTTN